MNLRATKRLKMVLVVDDDPDVRESVADVLNDAGYRVLQAANGHEALALLDECRDPCLVLLDMMMPGMNGAEVMAAMQACQRLASLPVVVYSAQSGPPPRRARCLLRKPVSVDLLLKTVEELCG